MTIKNLSKIWMNCNTVFLVNGEEVDDNDVDNDDREIAEMDIEYYNFSSPGIEYVLMIKTK